MQLVFKDNSVFCFHDDNCDCESMYPSTDGFAVLCVDDDTEFYFGQPLNELNITTKKTKLQQLQEQIDFLIMETLK